MQSPSASDVDGRRPEHLLPVVGIGASAGGLAPTRAVLEALGATPGVAVVVVHHLDPNHPSELTAILSTRVQMPVEVAADAAVLQANRVYVMPANTHVLVADGKLMVVRRPEGAVQLPIDRFFESLALDRSVCPVGVVLSGTGADGSHGVRAIKAEGGVTFAQNDSAEHEGMPTSAVKTGCVDFVLPPAEIAKELLSIGARAIPLVEQPDDSADLAQILAALRRATGIDFASYKPTTVRRRIQRRMLVHGLESFAAYYDLLARDAAEAAVVSEEILIHVTSFFRDPDVFSSLGSTVFPKLLDKRVRDMPIRIWIAGCSTGEEVYSIAIALLDHMVERDIDVPIRLFGTDVSTRAIEVARSGIYPRGIENHVSEDRLQRYFTRVDEAYQIRKEVRDLCIFAKHDATIDPPFSAMDLISCRNLMIYLGAALQDRLLPIFHYALKEPGFLVLGTSETTRSFAGFVLLDAKSKIYARTSAAPRILLNFDGLRSVEAAPMRDATTKIAGPLDVHREADRLVLAEFAPPGVVVTDDLAIVQFRGKTGPFLEPVPGVASFDLLRMVRADLRIPLRRLIDEARSKRRAARSAEIVAEPSGVKHTVEIEVIPFGVASTTQRFFVILFREPPAASAPEVPGTAASTPVEIAGQDGALAQELAATRDYLQSVIEQLEGGNEELRAANEEIVSSNEELRSTNEELQMAKEELQATNEELRTVNEEMSVRNAEGARLSNDLINVLNSVEIPMVILDGDGRLRRFTQAATKVIGVNVQDLGRRLSEIRLLNESFNLSRMVQEVSEKQIPVESTLEDDNGRWFRVSARPYVTSIERRVDGVVVVAYDIDETKRAEQLYLRAQVYAESIVNTVRECLLVLDRDQRVRSANATFHRVFDTTPEAVQGRRLAELGAGEWNQPELIARIQRLSEDECFDGLTFDHTVSTGVARSFEVSGRRIAKTSLVLLALNDVTAAKRAQALLEQSQREHEQALQRIAFDAAVAEERERRQIAENLHDNIGQAIALAKIKLASVRAATDGANQLVIDDAVMLLGQAVACTSDLTFEISPPVLYDLGLKEALLWLADDLRVRHGLVIKVSDDGEPKPLEDETAMIVFRAVRELVINVYKHAKISEAAIDLTRSGEHCQIEVADGGAGFDAEAVLARGSRRGYGLFSVRERIRRVGGSVTVSSRINHGTQITLRIPLKQD